MESQTYKDMQSQVLYSSYHNDPIGYKTLSMRNDSLSSNSSCNHNSPKYRQSSVSDVTSDDDSSPVEYTIDRTAPNRSLHTAGKLHSEQQIFDPIKEAYRNFLMNFKKRKAEASRKRDENIIKSKTRKAENFQIQPLMSDADYLKIVGMTKAEPKTDKSLFDDKLNKCMTSIQKDKQEINKNKLNRKVNRDNIKINIAKQKDKSIKELGRKKREVVSNRVAEEGPRNEKKLKTSEPLQSKGKRKSFDDERNHCTESASKNTELATKRKKISLEEYRLRRCISSNTSSAQKVPR